MTSVAHSTQDLRSAPRSSLMLRSAKVICQSGEYLCLIRDVSESGAGLRFFHAVPPEARIFLQLGNGALHPIERAWMRDDDAGYRFAVPVDVAEFIAEASPYPGRSIRMKVEREALVSVEGQDCVATLKDLSRTGACLIANRTWPIGAFVRNELPGLPIRYGNVARREGNVHGVAFQNVLPLSDLALHLLALQPFAQQIGENGWAIRAA